MYLANTYHKYLCDDVMRVPHHLIISVFDIASPESSWRKVGEASASAIKFKPGKSL